MGCALHHLHLELLGPQPVRLKPSIKSDASSRLCAPFDRTANFNFSRFQLSHSPLFVEPLCAHSLLKQPILYTRFPSNFDFRQTVTMEKQGGKCSRLASFPNLHALSTRFARPQSHANLQSFSLVWGSHPLVAHLKLNIG